MTKKVVYLSQEDYGKAISILGEFTALVLRWLARQSQNELKDQIIGNFIARGTVCLDSICRLWQVGNFQDGCILYRTLLDRFFHLRHLADHNEFEDFERWSFQRQFRMADIALSDPAIIAKLSPEELKEAKALHQERRIRFSQEPESSWSRPDAKEEAKRIKLPILYRVGYDYASTVVHPMADDGKEDFAQLLGGEWDSNENSLIILHNSLLVYIILINTGLVSSSVLWRKFVDEFYDQLLSFLETGASDYVSTYQKALTLDPNASWCEPKKNSE